VPTFHGVSPENAPPVREAAPSNEYGDGWPSVVLTEFEAVTPDAEMAEIAFQVTEELALELGRYRVVRVLQQRDHDARESSGPDRARFALRGRLRADGDDLRITTRLVERTTGEQIWGDEYHTFPHSGKWSGCPADVARVIAARVGSEEGVVVQL